MTTDPFIQTTSGLSPNAGLLGAPGAIVATSTTAQAINTGLQTFTIQTQAAFAAGMWVSITNATNANQWEWGTVKSYNGTQLTVQITNTNGTGSNANWQIALAGEPAGNQSGTITNAQLAAMPANTILANPSASPSNPSYVTLSALIDGDIGGVQGDILYRNATNWVVLAPGPANNLLATGGAAANPSWVAPPLSPTGALDTIGNTQGDILYRNATNWVVLAPGTAGYVLKSGGAAANPSWEALSGVSVTSFTGDGTVLSNSGSTGAVTATLAAAADKTVLSNISGGSAAPAYHTLSAVIDEAIGATQGDILYRNASGWVVLAPGTAGYLLITGGTAANPSWAAPTAAISAAGSDTQVQFNDAGTFGANAGLVYNYSTNTLTAAHINSTNDYQIGTNTVLQVAGTDNTAVGIGALKYLTLGTDNTAIGYLAGNSSGNGSPGLTGSCNTFIGSIAGYQQTTGSHNIAIGCASQDSAAGGSNNLSIGDSALNTVSGNYNIGIGHTAGQNLTTGTNNLIIGYQVAKGTLISGSGNVLIGTSSAVDTPGNATSNYLNINNWITGASGAISIPNLATAGVVHNAVTTGLLTTSLIINADVTSNTLTYGKLQQESTATLLGNPTGGTANVQEITLGAALTFSASALQTAAMTGDVTTSANSFATTVAKIAGVAVGTPTGTGNVVMSGSPTLTGTAIVGSITGSGTINTTGNLQLNGHGVVTKPVIQTFAASATYTPSTGMVYCIIECQGPGGGGGGVSLGLTQSGGGGGGGGGGYAKIIASAATIGASQAVTIGSGGGGGVGNGNGSAGSSNTSVGSICIAAAGSGGNGNGGGVATGGAGGAGSTGTVKFTGSNGGTPDFASITSVTTAGGPGGTSAFCGPTFGLTANSATTAGTTAVNPGGGGSGAAANASTASGTGGAGANGYVVITEFLSA